MKILVINSGSSSLKYQLFLMPEGKPICSGIVEKIGREDAIFTHKINSKKSSEVLSVLDHEKGLSLVLDTLVDKEIGILDAISEINAVGHRVVHGGSRFSNPTIITKEVKQQIKDLFSLAPLHNPANLKGIEVAEMKIPNAKQIAIFDTAFHQTMPKVAYQYAIPKKYLEENRIRAYGFHGTSHKYVSEKAIEYLGNKKNSKLITIHLGNGCSMSAIKNGQSIENSLGLGPMNGLVMGTRSGDIDQSVLLFMQRQLGMSVDEVNDVVQKESGLKGLTGYSDLREISELAKQGDKDCMHALKLAAYRIKKYIGAYCAILNGIDAIIFTAGIGENSPLMRRLSCENLDYLGIELDEKKNNLLANKINEIQTNSSRVKILVIPTNEEVEIAKQTFAILQER